MLPRFFAVEDWDLTTGHVDVYFKDHISQELMGYLEAELQVRTAKLSKDERTVYHLEQLVGGIFSDMAVKGKLKKDSVHNHWTLSGLMKCHK